MCDLTWNLACNSNKNANFLEHIFKNYDFMPFFTVWLIVVICFKCGILVKHYILQNFPIIHTCFSQTSMHSIYVYISKY